MAITSCLTQSIHQRSKELICRRKKRGNKRQQEHVTEEERSGADMKGVEKESKQKGKIPKQEDVWAFYILITALEKKGKKAT